MDPAISDLGPELTVKRSADDITQDEPNHEPLLEQQSDEQPTTAPRTKRKRYTLIACNECKRRKIKCNGEKPCQRCKHLDMQCIYSATCCTGFRESSEYVRMTAQIASLQEQVTGLYAAIAELRSAGLNQVYVHDGPPPPGPLQQQAPNAPLDSRTPNGTHTAMTEDLHDEQGLVDPETRLQNGHAGLHSASITQSATAPYAVMRLDDDLGEMDKTAPAGEPGLGDAPAAGAARAAGIENVAVAVAGSPG